MAAIKHHDGLDVLGQKVVDKLHTVVHIPTERNEQQHEKINNVVSEQVQHKPSCTSTDSEAG